MAKMEPIPLKDIIDMTSGELTIDELVTHAMVLIDPLGQHKEYFDLIKHIIVTFKKKNNDYAGSDAQDFMKNFARCENFGIDMVSGIITRMSDKITRMENLFRLRDQQVKDESLEDTILDLANYCLLLVVAMRRSNKNNDVVNWEKSKPLADMVRFGTTFEELNVNGRKFRKDPNDPTIFHEVFDNA